MEHSHLVSLESKHAGIEQKIIAEMRRPLPDSVALASLKKQKLRTKEAITNF
jgi:hypothetical protein